MPFQFRKEAIEEDLNSNFPSQGQGNPPLYYSLSEVVVPTYSINQSAEGTSLPEMLQTAWDFSTGSDQARNNTQTIISTTGFWKVDLTCQTKLTSENPIIARMWIDDGASEKNIWAAVFPDGANEDIGIGVTENSFICYLRSGDTLQMSTDSSDCILDAWYRQVADLNGNLVNPLGFSFA